MLTQEEFNRWSNDYEESIVSLSLQYPFAGYREVLNFIYEEIKDDINGKLLFDIGIGTGLLSKKLYDLGAKIYGLDFSEKMLEQAKIKMPNATFIYHDFTNGIPEKMKELQFNFIISSYSFHHLDDLSKVTFILNLKKHLIPGGKIFIGDISFQSKRELEFCRKSAEKYWDESEFYIIAESFIKMLSIHEVVSYFIPLSSCAGVLVIEY